MQALCDALVGWWPAFQDWLTEKHLAWGIPVAITGLILPIFFDTANLQKLADADRAVEVDSRIQTRYRSQQALPKKTPSQGTTAEKLPRVVVALVDETAIRTDLRLEKPSPISRTWMADFIGICRRGGASALAIDFTTDTPDSRETLGYKDTDFLAAALKAAQPESAPFAEILRFPERVVAAVLGRPEAPPMPVVLATRSFSTTYCGRAQKLIILPEKTLSDMAQTALAEGAGGFTDNVIRFVPLGVTGSLGIQETQANNDPCPPDQKKTEERKAPGNTLMLPAVLAADYRRCTAPRELTESIPGQGECILRDAAHMEKTRDFFFGDFAESEIRIDYTLPYGHPDSVEVVSAQHLFDLAAAGDKDKRLRTWLKGRAVVLGSGYQKSEDWQETPLSTPYFGIFKAKGQKMAGAEIMGRATASLLAATAPEAIKPDKTTKEYKENFWDLLSVRQPTQEVVLGIGVGFLAALILWGFAYWLRSESMSARLAWAKQDWGAILANSVCVVAFAVALYGLYLVFKPLREENTDIRFSPLGWCMMGGALLVFAPFSGAVLRSSAWIMMTSWLGAFGWTAVSLSRYLLPDEYEYWPMLRPIFGIFLGGMVVMLFWRREETKDKEAAVLRDSQAAKESLASEFACIRSGSRDGDGTYRSTFAQRKRKPKGST